MPDKLGSTKHKHLQSVIKQLRALKRPTDAIEKQLEPVPLKHGTEYLLQMFDALSRTRTYGDSGANPITHLEIKAYCDLMDEKIAPWEVDAIRRMDAAYIAVTTEIARASQQGA